MTPKAECKVLMKEMVAFAERMLCEHGEFHPFGGTILRDGRVALAGGQTGEEMLRAVDLIRVLTDGFRQDAAAGDIRAAALVVNVSTLSPNQSNKVDAIRIALDHRDHYAVRVFFPYHLLAEGGVKLDPPFALGNLLRLSGPRHRSVDGASLTFAHMAPRRFDSREFHRLLTVRTLCDLRTVQFVRDGIR
jgi:hypothetical protein